LTGGIKMSRINRKTLQTRSEYLQFDDVCCFSSLDYWNEEHLQTVDLTWEPWMAEAFPRYKPLQGILAESGNILLLHKIQSEYKSYRVLHKTEPDWIKKLPEPNRQYLRFDYFVTNDETEPYHIFATLPFSGIGYIILEDGIAERTINLFKLYRLGGIKQLGYLHFPTITKDGPIMLVRGFPHNRYVHSLDVATIGMLILASNGFSEKMQQLYRVAGMTHDTLTPPGSDSIKWIDRKLFDEDLHYPELMARIDWSQLPELLANARKLLPQIILNRGILGSVLDIADKIAYISRDLQAFYINGPKLDGYYELKDLLKEEPQPCSLWECVRIKNDRMYFSDKARLINFLMIRATMFGKLYSNPSSRFWELFVKTFVQKRLYETGKLTRDMLLRMQDMHLHEMINANIEPYFMDSFVGQRSECMETFETLEQAQAREQQLRAKGRRVIMIEEAFVAKAGVHFLVETNSGLQPLSKADPESAQRIKDTMDPGYKFGLHYLDIHFRKLPKALRDWQS
jgi:HD superfamily phosphohydrolase